MMTRRQRLRARLAFWWTFHVHTDFCMVCDRALFRWETRHWRRHTHWGTP